MITNKVNYLSNLTPLRGIAALLTVVFHIDLMLGNGGNLLLRFEDSMLINRLYLMVDFFFILSGFIMLHVYGAWFEERVTMRNFKQFTIARFARVYPLHLFTLLLVLLIWTISVRLGVPPNPILQTYNDGYSFLSNVFLVQAMNLHEWFSYNHAAWSISTEWWMYMLFPFLVKPFSTFNRNRIVAIIIGCLIGYACITFLIIPTLGAPSKLPYLAGNGSFNNSINVGFRYGFLRCMCGFVLGMMTYKCYLINWGKDILSRTLVMVILVIGLFTCLHFATFDIISVLFFPLILLSSAYGNDTINRIFSSKILQKLGDWSFSIYLTHQPLMFIISSICAYFQITARPSMGLAWIITLLFIALVLLISYVTYRWIEVSARQWINKNMVK